MGIRNKILLYFSFTTILLTGVVLFLIYRLFAEYREEEFHRWQKEKIKSTLFFLSEIKKADKELIETIDRLTINEFYDEKLLIFNAQKSLIYSSIDDTPIHYPKIILDKLSHKNEWYENQEGRYDIVGLYFENEGSTYFGISKAYDKFGYSKLYYLRMILIASFVVISVAVVLLSYFLSQKITRSLISITNQISNYNFDSEYVPISHEYSKDEISILAEQFNKLMQKTSQIFTFQKHTIHHISHELKTPIAILVSNFERIENETDIEKVLALIKIQKEDTKRLSEIINSLLELSKIESGLFLKDNSTRVDEKIFDIADELKGIYPDFQFSIQYIQAENEDALTVLCNSQLLKSAFMNLMLNCIQYSSDNKAKISFEAQDGFIQITFANKGSIISEEESQFLFQHFFRGKNSQGKKGFGLGLVLVHKIISLHKGKVSYQTINDSINVFTISIPLS